MSNSNPEEFNYEAHGGGLPTGATLNSDQMNKLLKECLKKHNPAKPTGGGGGQVGQQPGPENCVTSIGFIWAGDSDTGGWVPVPISSCDPFSGIGAASQ